MEAKDLIANSRLAFLNQENETALNLAKRAIACLNAARNPAVAYNNGFEVMEIRSEIHELSDYDVEDMIAEDRLDGQKALSHPGYRQNADIKRCQMNVADLFKKQEGDKYEGD